MFSFCCFYWIDSSCACSSCFFLIWMFNWFILSFLWWFLLLYKFNCFIVLLNLSLSLIHNYCVWHLSSCIISFIYQVSSFVWCSLLGFGIIIQPYETPMKTGQSWATCFSSIWWLVARCRCHPVFAEQLREALIEIDRTISRLLFQSSVRWSMLMHW